MLVKLGSAFQYHEKALTSQQTVSFLYSYVKYPRQIHKDSVSEEN